jgi:DNA polymerase-3 subunit gamma/tau
VLARRAAGSMRDSQSLLEQLLAFSQGRITVEDVHGMLGTAGDALMVGLVRHIVERQAAAALADLDAALHAGVDVTQLIEQLFGYFRDCMAAAAGCSADSFLYVSPSHAQEMIDAGKKMGLHTILAVMQILDQTLSRARFSTFGRILAELALVQICRLEDLDELPNLIAELRGGAPMVQTLQTLPTLQTDQTVRPIQNNPSAPSSLLPSAGDAAGKKNIEPSMNSGVPGPSLPPAERPVLHLTPENAVETWQLALGRLSGMAVDQARCFHRVAAVADDRLLVSFRPEYAVAKSSCERPEQLNRFEQALSEVAGRRIRIDFALDAADAGGTDATPPPRTVSQHQLTMEIAKHPLIQRAAELFGAVPTRVEPPPPNK